MALPGMFWSSLRLRESIPLKNITHLLYLISLRLPITSRLNINNLAYACFAKHMMIAANTFVEAQPLK